MRWLYTLSLRAPGSTVILVANKCDGSTDKFTRIVDHVETRARVLLEEWCALRGLDHDQAVKGVNLLDRTSAISCVDFLGVEGLIDRVSEQGATMIKVPPAWDLALTVIDALRDGRDPQQAARIRLKYATSKNEEDAASVTRKRHITLEELLGLWNGIVANGAGLKAEQEAAMINSRGALEGALWVR